MILRSDRKKNSRIPTFARKRSLKQSGALMHGRMELVIRTLSLGIDKNNNKLFWWLSSKFQVYIMLFD